MKLKSEYTSLQNWRKTNPKDYKAAQRRGLLGEVAKHYGWEHRESKPIGYWTKNKILDEARKYKKIKDWKKNSIASYRAAQKNKILDEATAHMERMIKHTPIKKPRGYWNKERVLKDSKKYNKISEWKEKNESALRAARRLGIYDEATKHMKRSNTFWTKEMVLEISSKYDNKLEWRTKEFKCYKASQRLGIYNEATKHMK